MFKFTKKIGLLCLTFMVALTLLPTNIFAKTDEATIIDDKDSIIEYSAGGANKGGWDSWGQNLEYTDSEHWSNSANATMKFTFTGTQIELYGKKDISHAKFSVSIDGGTPSVHDEYAPSKRMNDLIYKSNDLTSGEHTITIKVLGERNPESTGTGDLYGFQFSYAKVFNSDAEQEMETLITDIDDATTGTGINQFEFVGTWIAEQGVASDFKGTEHWSNKSRWGATPPSVNIRFKGNKIEVFGKKENTGAIYKAVIDGDEANATEIDTYNVGVQSQERLYVKEGLKEGEHTLTLTVLKKFNTLGGSYDKVNVGAMIDYAKVTSLEPVTQDKKYETMIDNTEVTTTNELFKYQLDGTGWTQGTGNSLFYKGTEAYSNNASASYSIKFIGSGFELIASKNTGHANYTVSIDGVVVGEAIAKLPSGSAQHYQSLFKKLDLQEGEHTLKVAIKAGTSGAIQADAVKITHRAIAPTSITLDKESLSIEAGLTNSIKSTLTPSYANGTVEYTIANTQLATISTMGEITALKAGSTTITATVKGTSISKTIPLTITPEGLPVAISVGDEKFMVTQDSYNNVLSQGKTTWSGVAWRGDILNSKVDLATKKAIKNATVTASDFTNGKATIKASNLEINWLKETMANIGRGNSGAPVKPFQDIIHKGGKLDIPAKKVQTAWININVPKDAKPGIYTGTISVDADELEEPVVLNYTFEVLDLLQPNPESTDTQVQLWQHPFSVANYYGVAEKDYFGTEHLNYMRESMKEYKSLGGTEVVANIVEEAWDHQSYYGDPSMVKWIKKADGSFTFNYDWFDKWINFQVETGVLNPEEGIGAIKCFSIVPWGDRIIYFDEATNKMVEGFPTVNSTEWKFMWTSFLTDFTAHLEDKGWYDITYIALDERPMNRVGPAVDLIETIKNSEGKSFKISSAFNYESGNDYSFLDRIHDISVGLSHVKDSSEDMRKMAAHREELGLTTTIYTCTGDYPGNYTISEPVDNAWCLWYTMKQNTNGYMKWAWDNWVEDPLTNVNYKYWEPGDGWFIYPTEKGVNSSTYFYKTPRYEMLKQGVRDVNKAKYLMANSETLSPEIDKLVKSLKRPKAGGNGYGSAVPASETDRLLAGSEVVRMREGIAAFAREYIKSEVVPVSSISLNKDKVSLEVGSTETLIATVLPENATDKTLIWTTSDAAIASVKDGAITGNKAGEATISVTNSNGEITKEIKVSVKDKAPEIIPVTSIVVNKDNVTLEVGKEETISAIALPENATNKNLIWKSSDETIAKVKNGVISAVKKGNATITIFNSDKTVSTVIKVTVLDIKDEGSTEITNKDGNITVIGNFPSTIELITKLLSKEEQKAIATKLVAQNKEFFSKHNIESVYDITLMDGKEVYKVDGNVVVKIKLDKAMLNKKLKVLYVKEDGTYEQMVSSRNGDYIQFITNHFSTFAIVSEKPKDETKPGGDKPNTGDTTNTVGWSFVLLLAGCTLFGVRQRNKKLGK